MAYNVPSAYGTDLACVFDADPFFSSATGIGLLIQDTYHRLTVNNILAPDEPDGTNTGLGWGYDVRQLLGMDPLTAGAIGPTLEGFILRDERILSASVVVAVTGIGDGVTSSATIQVDCETALGPFSRILTVNQLTSDVLLGEAA